MSKPIEISEEKLNRLNKRIRDEYPNSVFLLKEKHAKVLGFTVRRHDPLTRKEKDELAEKEGWRAVLARKQVLLDFYSEKKRTWFLMKYSDIINGD